MRGTNKNSTYWCSEFKRAAYAATIEEHNRRINSISRELPDFPRFYAETEPACWANSLFQGYRWGVVNNNQAECWNNWVLEARSLPLVPMLMHIHSQIMVMMSQRRDEGEGMTGLICPKPAQRLSARQMESRSLILRRAGRGTYEVTDPVTNHTYAVDLTGLTCSCRLWQIERMPCSHACACIESSGRSLYEFVDPFFNCTMYQLAYEKTFVPIPTVGDGVTDSDEEDEEIRPPDTRVPPGRPRTARYPSQVENKRTKKCGRCGKPGHDRRSCTQPI